MKHRLLNYSELGQAVGSKRGLDPIPPDQYQSKMDPRYPPHERLLAWVTANTMGEGHRAAYCVDAHGRELTLADARRDLKLDGSLAKRTWKYLEQEGRVREHKGRLYLCGEVNLPAAEIVPEFGLDSPESDCTVRVSTYILNKLKELPKVQQQKYWSWRKAKTAKYLVVRRELIALQRLMEEQEEDSVLLSLGIEPKHQKKRRAEPVAHLPLFQPLIASIVQSSDGDDSSPTVQSANPRLSNPENGSVQDVSRAPSLYIEKSREDRETHTPVLSTDLERRGAHSPDFERFIGGFLSAGKLLNEQDVAKTYALWNTLPIEDRLTAIADLEPKLTNGTWSDALHTPMPINYLRSEAWKRKGPGRILPTPPKNHREAQLQEAEERFLMKGAK